MSHSIDFHASQTAMDHQMVEIKPGATFTYTFTADYAGVWMYHCGTAPTIQHIANGMFGMVIVEPKGGFAKVDHEYAFVQSEWYLGAQGQPADYLKAAAGAPSPDFVVFNGVASQYKDNPIPVAAKDRIRIFILDAGPNIDSSFHVVGTIFDTVHKEGISLLKGNPDGWGSQAVDLSPAQAPWASSRRALAPRCPTDPSPSAEPAARRPWAGPAPPGRESVESGSRPVRSFGGRDRASCSGARDPR